MKMNISIKSVYLNLMQHKTSYANDEIKWLKTTVRYWLYEDRIYSKYELHKKFLDKYNLRAAK